MVEPAGKGAKRRAHQSAVRVMVGTPSDPHSRVRRLCPPYGATVRYPLPACPNTTSISVPDCAPGLM
jgi:hypothetical protein